jgi:hypothetical protein
MNDSLQGPISMKAFDRLLQDEPDDFEGLGVKMIQ